MATLREWLRRIIGSLRLGRADRDLEDELRLHVELARGDRQPIVGVAHAMDALRDQRGLPWLDDLTRDVKYAVRALRRSPGFTALVLLTLALGIGANAAIFSVVYGVLIKPLPYPDADRLVALWHVAPGLTEGEVPVAPTMYFTYREEGRTFERLGLWSEGAASVTGEGEPEQVRAAFVTFGTLDTLGVAPALGQWFTSEDDTPDAPDTVLLGHGYWERKYGGDPAAIGRSLTVDSHPRRIIGVMPPGYRIVTADPDVILPLQFDRDELYLGTFSYRGVARLKSGVGVAAANADIARMLPGWLNAWPPFPGASRELFRNARMAPNVRPLKQDVVGDIGPVLWVLMGTLGVVLLIVCANVANLLLVRADGRRQELAIRAALGAGWGRIARALLVESAVLGLLGGALGVALAFAALRLLVSFGPAELPRLAEIGIDPVVLGFALSVSLLTALLFGLVPVVRYTGPWLASSLAGESRTSSASPGRQRARSTLAIAQVALALVLVIGAGLMVRSFEALRAVEPGFAGPQAVQIAHINIPQTQIAEPERVIRLEQDVLDRLAAIPGVQVAALANSVPMEGRDSADALAVDGREGRAGEFPPVRRFKFITPGYFAAAGTRIVAGRDLTWTDLYGDRRVALVSENLARELWNEPAAALGQRVREVGDSPWREVIGVVADVREDGADRPAPAMVYWPALMHDFWGREYVQRAATILVRSARAGTTSFLDEFQAAVWAANPNLPVAGLQTLGDVYDASMARTWFTLILLAIAGGMALALGLVGIYGVMAYAVAQRTREIGIRLALGADPSAVRRMFVRDGLRLACVGAAAGTAAAFGLTRVMDSLLYGVDPQDVPTFAAGAAAVVIAALLASDLPARRSTRVDPATTLRAE